MNQPIVFPQVPVTSKRSLKPLSHPELNQKIADICRRVPPWFSLRDMVAVSPFHGRLERTFLESVMDLQRVFGECMLPERKLVRKWIERGELTSSGLALALVDSKWIQTQGSPTFDELSAWANSEHGAPQGPKWLTLGEAWDRATSSSRAELFEQQIFRFLNSRIEDARGQKTGSAHQLLPSFQEHFLIDWSTTLLGLSGFKQLLKGLSSDPTEWVALLSQELVGRGLLSSEDLESYLEALLVRRIGHASFERGRVFVEDPSSIGELPSLLAIWALSEFVFLKMSDETGAALRPTLLPADPGFEREFLLRGLGLEAREASWLSGFQSSLAESPKPEARVDERQPFELAFCIDVRSERIRRHLESSSQIATRGIAGFFGLPVSFEHNGEAQMHCPPLLKPSLQLKPEKASPSLAQTTGKVFHGMKRRLSDAPVASFSFVEAFGMTSGVGLLRDALRLGPRPVEGEILPDLDSIPYESRLAWARSMMSTLGWREHLPRLFIFVGHGSYVTNNPQSAGLSCGACAGKSGKVSALLAAGILNDPKVQADLLSAGGPDLREVYFVGGVHDTMTDRIELFPRGPQADAHLGELVQLRQDLELAAERTRAERASELSGLSGDELARDLSRRAKDYAEVQPEWALAGNRAFVVARRSRTKPLSGEGQWFLHCYDESLDPGGELLTTILTAPVVVGSWINLQYYASTLLPGVLGSGRKTIHNVVGDLAVLSGGEGDLRVGLARESVMRGDELMHDPLRLHVIVEASPERILRIVETSQVLTWLIRGRYLKVYSLDRSSASLEPILIPELSPSAGGVSAEPN